MKSKMTIRQKTLLLTILILAGSLLLVVITTRSIIIRETEPMETRQVSDRVRIITYLLNQKQHDLEKWIIDWANWDEAYDFMKTGSPAFITVNLSPSYFKVYDIEHLLFLLPNGLVRYACTYNFASQTQRDLSPALLDKLGQLAALGAGKNGHKVTSGIFRSGATFYAAATQPVLTSKELGPPRGMLVFANELENAELRDLGKIVSQPFEIMPITDRRIPDATRELLLRLPRNTPHLERLISDQEAEGFSLFSDILTGEKFVIRMKAPRTFYAEGKQITNYFVWAIIGIGGLLIMAMMVLLNRTVLVPLKNLSRKVSRLDLSQSDELLHEPDGEELNTLAHTINTAMESLKQARKQAESATESKSRFLATMTHELRTPLNAILGLSETLLDRISGPLNNLQSSALQSIHDSGLHLLSLISDILDISKIEAGKMELLWQDIDVDELCRSCIGYMAAPAAVKDINLAYRTESAPIICHGDLRRMKQILLNLLGNAVKFTPHGGSVVLEITGDTATGEALFTVRDNGIGISAEQQQQLFQPFMQVDDSLSRRHEGTGLGLALVAQLTSLHQGTVTVESRLGEGSRFTVTIPWHEERCALDTATPPFLQEPSGLPAPSPESPDTSPLSPASAAPLILLAEDNQIAFNMVEAYLRGEGYRVIGARTGDEAVALAVKELPALALMDIQMPGMNGLEAIRCIRELPAPTGTIPIIALTALASPEDRDRCLTAGADDYVGKPVRLKELCRHIKLLLTSQTQTEPT